MHEKCTEPSLAQEKKNRTQQKKKEEKKEYLHFIRISVHLMKGIPNYYRKSSCSESLILGIESCNVTLYVKITEKKVIKVKTHLHESIR